MRIVVVLAGLLALSATARAETVVREWSGQGAMTTRPVTFSGPWRLQWQADGVFLVHLVTDDGRMVVSVLANQVAAGAGSSDVVQGGTYFIAVNALAPWTARAVLVGP